MRSCALGVIVRGETNFEGQDTATHTATHIAIDVPHTGEFLCACVRTGNKLAKEEKERIKTNGGKGGGENRKRRLTGVQWPSVWALFVRYTLQHTATHL